jgi:hypothetical protein
MNTKRFFLFFFFAVATTFDAFSQYAPKGMSYQAVARDEKGFELKNKGLEVRISIIDPSGISEYSELHSPVTDKYGLFSLIIGQGSYLSGSAGEFSKISWGSGAHSLKVEVDFGSGFKNMGTTQFLSVPYALYAENATNVAESKDDQVLNYDPVKKELSLENGGKADLSGLYEDKDSDPENEIQTLSYINNTLYLSNSNSVIIDTKDADSDPQNELQNLYINGDSLCISSGNKILTDVSKTNELQTISRTGDSIQLSLGGGSVRDLVDDADHDPRNEIQNLSLSGYELSLSDGNTVTLTDLVDDADADPSNELQNLYITGDSLGISSGNKILTDVSKTNELQTISRTGDSIQLSLGGGSVRDLVDDADHDPRNEIQNLSLSGYELSLSGGNSVTLTDLVDDADADPANELQSLYIIGDSIGILRGNKIFTDVSKTNEIQILSRSGDSIRLSLGGGAFKDMVDDADNNPSNEFQDLSWNGSVLSISNGNEVTLSDLYEDADANPTNELQDIYLDAVSNVLTITNSPAKNNVYLQKFMDNTDNQSLSVSGDSLGISQGNRVFVDVSKTNEIQTLGRVEDSISLSLNGGKVSVNDADSSPTNELQTPVLTGNNLSLSNDPTSAVVSLNKYVDNTDRQKLSINGYNLSIDSGNTVNTRPKIIAFRALTAGSGIPIPKGESLNLIFETEKLDSTNVYNTLNNGEFIVPTGGEGLYHFELIYQFVTNQTIEIFVNDSSYEQILSTYPVYPIILYLTEGSSIKIVAKTSATAMSPTYQSSGVFSGYRIH